ncbi:OmpA family protein [Mucilaginibacter sp. PAMB04274]|uniref:OmpA family protein n=1 Tax=Mucilaginibacter sp. PAMB04274 TaxID=3138568 RepID=UPI0031F66F32
MKAPKIYFLSVTVLLGLSFGACKTKKLPAKPAPPPAAAQPAPPPQAQAPAPAQQPKEEPATPPAKPNFNFSNIQFEFNSAVLKTGSYETLDKVVGEMKKDPSAKFTLNGHSSAEGTAEHNQSLSVDRANSVKSYLINGGINGANLTVRGWGESKPITTNTNEEARALNRRVEIKLN